MYLATLETSNFEFTAIGKNKRECIDLLECACHAHSLEYMCDFAYFLDLLKDEGREPSGNVRFVEIHIGRAYRDGEEIVR